MDERMVLQKMTMNCCTCRFYFVIIAIGPIGLYLFFDNLLQRITLLLHEINIICCILTLCVAY